MPKVVTDELALMDRADLLVLQYPMWWHLPPAMMKGWFDRVLAYGAAYTSKKRFENGRFAGKRAMLSVTVGTSRATYEHDGRSGDIDLMLWPVNFTLAYVGYRDSRALRRLWRRGGAALLRPRGDRRPAAGRSSPISARRSRASPSARPSRSTGWRSGVRTAASFKAPRSTRRLSAARSGSLWSDRRAERGRDRQDPEPSLR